MLASGHQEHAAGCVTNAAEAWSVVCLKVTTASTKLIIGCNKAAEGCSYLHCQCCGPLVTRPKDIQTGSTWLAITWQQGQDSSMLQACTCQCCQMLVTCVIGPDVASSA